MNVSFYNLGCKVNLADISRIGKQFEELGHTVVDFETPSDIVLINTCTVTHRADADCRNVVRRALKKSPEAFVGVLGCYAQLQPEAIAKIEGVDAVIGTREKFEIPNLIKKFEKTKDTQLFISNLEDTPFHTSAVSDNAGRTRAVLKIQDGCNYHCTFCTIPLARGNSRSMEFANVMPELYAMQKQGFYEVVLSGINLGDFKNADGKKFYDVVRAINDSDLQMRFRISSIEPNLLKDNILEEVLSEGSKFCPHFHIPMQSGSQEILFKMRRRYKADYYKNLVDRIHEINPNAAIGADVIVGFPGETEDHFAETYDLISNSPITYLHAFTYSERENTPAATMDGVVPFNIRQARNKRLRDLSDEKRLAFYERQIGTTGTVIPEMYNQDNGLWRGWTENYVSVNFASPADLSHAPMQVKLDKMFESKVYATPVDQEFATANKPKYLELEVLG